MQEDEQELQVNTVEMDTTEDSLARSHVERIPEDKNNIIYWTCFTYGVVMLIPWNCVISTVPFFEA